MQKKAILLELKIICVNFYSNATKFVKTNNYTPSFLMPPARVGSMT